MNSNPYRTPTETLTKPLQTPTEPLQTPTKPLQNPYGTPTEPLRLPTMKFTLHRPEFDKIFTNHAKYKILTGDDDDDTTTIKVPIFEDGPLKAALHWRKQFQELATLKEFNTQAKFMNASLLLSGEAKEKWIDARDDILQDQNPTDIHFENTMNQFIINCGANPGTTEDLRDFIMNARKPSSMKIQDFKC